MANAGRVPITARIESEHEGSDGNGRATRIQRVDQLLEDVPLPKAPQPPKPTVSCAPNPDDPRPPRSDRMTAA